MNWLEDFVAQLVFVECQRLSHPWSLRPGSLLYWVAAAAECDLVLHYGLYRADGRISHAAQC